MHAKVLKVNIPSTEIERDVLGGGAFSNVFLSEFEGERFATETLEVEPQLHKCYCYDLVAYDDGMLSFSTSDLSQVTGR